MAIGRHVHTLGNLAGIIDNGFGLGDVTALSMAHHRSPRRLKRDNKRRYETRLRTILKTIHLIMMYKPGGKSRSIIKYESITAIRAPGREPVMQGVP